MQPCAALLLPPAPRMCVYLVFVFWLFATSRENCQSDFRWNFTREADYLWASVKFCSHPDLDSELEMYEMNISPLLDMGKSAYFTDRVIELLTNYYEI